MVALRTYDDLPRPLPDGLPVSRRDTACLLEAGAWIRLLGSLVDEPASDRHPVLVCIDLDAATGIDATDAGETRLGTALAALALPPVADVYGFHSGSRSEAKALQRRVAEVMPRGGVQFELALDRAAALSRARDLGQVAVVDGPKIIVSYGSASRLPFAFREILRGVGSRRTLVRAPGRCATSLDALAAFCFQERRVDLVLGLPREAHRREAIEATLRDPSADQMLCDLFGSSAWRPIVRADLGAAPRMLRALYAQRIRTQLGLHVGDELLGPGKWAPAKPIFATTHERRLQLWREATSGLASPPDELYLDGA